MTLGKTKDIGKDRRWQRLTTFVTRKTVSSTNREDSPMIVREGGVEEQSTRIDQTDDDHDMARTRDLDTEKNSGNGNSFRCELCSRTFGSLHGMRVHQGKTCKRKNKQGGSEVSVRKTRSKSTQEENHSGMINASANDSNIQVENCADQTLGGVGGKPRVSWPAAKETEKYKTFEEKVLQKFKEDAKDLNTIQEHLILFTKVIYETAVDEFGTQEATSREKKKGGKSRNEKKSETIKKRSVDC